MSNWILIVLVVFLIISVIFAKFYHRSSKDVAFVRTGFGGERVVLSGGALAIPIIHQITEVSMNTIRLDVERARERALITKDHMRVDLEVSFYLRVAGTKDDVALAAQTLGARTLNPQAILDLLEGKLVDAIRAAVAEMSLDELHGSSRGFVERVRALINEAGTSNGLELESVSLSRLDQTAKTYFDASNTFDAQGLIRITRETEESRRTRNEIEKATETKVQDTNLAAEAKALIVKRESEYARLQAELEIAQRRAEQTAMIAQIRAEQMRTATAVEIEQNETVAKLRIVSDQTIQAERIRGERLTREAEIEKGRALEIAEIERDTAMKIASEQRMIELLGKQKERADVSLATSQAEARAVTAAESVETAREVASAERDREVNMIKTERLAREKALAATISAEAEKQAATNVAEARQILARAEAAAQRMKFEAEADGKRQLNDAANTLSDEQIAMQVRLAAFEALPAIIRESVKSMEKIDSIKIIDVTGMSNGGNAVSIADGDPGAQRPSGDGAGGGDLIDRAVGGALRYRMQAPVVDNLLREVGLIDGKNGIEQMVTGRGDLVNAALERLKAPRRPDPVPPGPREVRS